MKKTELNKLREKKVEDIKKEVLELKQQRDKARADISVGAESNLKKAYLLKKEVAQYLTILKQKEGEQK